MLLFVASLVSFPRRKSVRRVVEWHDQQVSSKILNMTKIYQLIDVCDPRLSHGTFCQQSSN